MVAILEAPTPRVEVSSLQSIAEVRVFAQRYHGVRPGRGDPLNFDLLGVPIGFAPNGYLEPDETKARLERIPHASFWHKTRVVALPLMIRDGSITDSHYRMLKRKIETVEMGRIIMESDMSKNANPVLILMQNPMGHWITQFVQSTDLLAPVGDIREEIRHLERQSGRSSFQEVRLGMKQAVWYMFTGENQSVA